MLNAVVKEDSREGGAGCSDKGRQGEGGAECSDKGRQQRLSAVVKKGRQQMLTAVKEGRLQ